MRTVDPQAGPKNLYRMLPSVDEVLRDESVEPLLRLHERDAVLLSAQRTLDEIREEIFNEVHSEETLSNRVKALPQAIAVRLNKPHDFSLRRVINATGVILHTNLGRAPLSKLALDRIVETASGYSNLEFDSETGERGRRDVHVESLLLSVLGDAANIPDLGDTHRAIVVNNCAAATFLVLHALAKDKDVLVSRGELVEIGGGFRIPEILAASGANLREVGTTNRTRIADYESAITTNAGLILRVHQSNFSMEGFIETPAIEQLVALGARTQLPVFFDQGTGLVDSLVSGGVTMGESTVGDCIVRGCERALLGLPARGKAVRRTGGGVGRCREFGGASSSLPGKPGLQGMAPGARARPGVQHVTVSRRPHHGPIQCGGVDPDHRHRRRRPRRDARSHPLARGQLRRGSAAADSTSVPLHRSRPEHGLAVRIGRGVGP